MKTLLVIILIVAVIAGGIYVATKYLGLFTDNDKDGIPDEIEDKVAEAKEVVEKTTTEVKRRARRVKQELNDVAEAAKDVVEQAADVAGAVKGNPRKGRKPRRKPSNAPKGNNSSTTGNVAGPKPKGGNKAQR